MRVKNLGLERRGKWLFRGLNMEIWPGSFVAIHGPSGVGKTSLLSCLCGDLEPSEGSVEVAVGDEAPGKPENFRARFGIVFQSLQLTPNADLLCNVLCGQLARFSWLRTLFGFPRSLRHEAYRLLCDLGVGEDPHKWVAQMSGGEQQRVAVARALFQQPAIYFADEPVSSLDPTLADRVIDKLRQEAKERQCAVFCVLHNADLIQRFADVALGLDPRDPTAWDVRQLRPAS